MKKVDIENFDYDILVLDAKKARTSPKDYLGKLDRKNHLQPSKSKAGTQDTKVQPFQKRASLYNPSY